MNPNFKKKKPLPYKNLGELYIETAYHEPSISRLVSVLLEDETVEAPPPRETVEVISQDTSSPEASAGEYTVDKVYFNNEIIPRLELGHPDKITVRTIIAKRLLKLNAQNIATTIDMYQEFIEGLGIVLDDDKAEKFGSALTGEYTKNTFSDLLKDTYALKADPSSDDRWQAVFEAKPLPIAGGRKQPGDGELFISFFSNSKRPPTGDVQIGDVKIEVKGYQGRLYKGLIQRTPLPDKDTFKVYPNDNKIDFIVKFIINLAGGGAYNDIKPIVTGDLNTLATEIYKSVTVDKAPLLTRIIGAQQLLLYKEEANFNNFLIFNKKIAAPDVPYIVFEVPSTLQEIIKIFADNNISIKIHDDKVGHMIVWPASL